jgi:L-idonate 5-dehydrogenase
MSIQGFVLTAAEHIEAQTLESPTPQMGEVLVDVRRVGICGSDIEYYRHFQCGVFVPREPFVLGHEFSGDVIALGDGVDSVAVGDRVAFEPSVPCGTCLFCREGRYNLCDNLRFYGTAAYYPHIDGAFREQIAVPAVNTIKLPNHVDYGAGALLEPLAVAVHAVRRARPVDGANVLITGGGTIGQLVAMVARALGAARVTVSDPVAQRREFALAHGVDAGVDPTSESLADIARSQPRGGWDILFEASGQEQAIVDGIGALRKGGCFVQIGTIARPVTIPANLIMVKELDMKGTFRYVNDFPMALHLLSEAKIPAMDIVTATYSFPDSPEAFRAAVGGQELKVQVERGAK